MLQCVTEMLFILNLLREMMIQINTPMIIYEDNQGAIFLANNKTTGQQTKHIDVRYHFICELIDNGELEIKYIRSEENRADLLTKNLGEEKLTKFGKMILGF